MSYRLTSDGQTTNSKNLERIKEKAYAAVVAMHKRNNDFAALGWHITRVSEFSSKHLVLRSENDFVALEKI